MRLLVLDESQVLVSVVKRVVPTCVEVETAGTFEAAWHLLRQRTPDAVIANVGPNDLPWDSMRDYCQRHDPQIPVLFESCVHRSAAEAGLGPLNHNATFIRKPYPLEELKAQIDRLVREALETRGQPEPCAQDDDLLVDNPAQHPDSHLNK